MTEPLAFDFEAWFTSRYSLVVRLTAAIARALGIRGDDADDFAAWAAMRLWEHDYALLRKWRGQSSLETYVRVVVTNLGREYRVLMWGRWRPSAAALRLGRVAILLEQLVYRDGMRPHEAFELLRTRGEVAGNSDRDLAALLAQLPVRPRRRRGDEPETTIETIADDRSTADNVLVVDERDAQFREVLRVLHAAVATLPPLRRDIVELNFIRVIKIPELARLLDVEPKRLYREREHALATLQRLLTDAGIAWAEVSELLGGDQAPPDEPNERDAPHELGDPEEFLDPDARDNAPPRPSNES